MKGSSSVRRRIVSLLSLLSVAVYIGSFFLPIVSINDERPCLGYEAFLMALFYPLMLSVFMFPVGLLSMVVWFPSWLANVAYWSALQRLQTGDTQKAAIRSGLGVFLGLTVMPALGMVPDHFRVGYWCWIGSMAVLTLTAATMVDGRSTIKTRQKKVWEDVRTWEEERGPTRVQGGPTRMSKGEARRESVLSRRASWAD